jgi:transmembrane 9 superfamily protein 3
MLASLVGSGYHVASVTLAVVFFATVGDSLYTERGSLLNTSILMYAITSPVNGFFGGSLYARKGGKLWIKQMVVGALLVPALISATAFFINFIAIYYQAAKALHFTSMVCLRFI